MSVLKCIQAKIDAELLDPRKAEEFLERVEARKGVLREQLKNSTANVDPNITAGKGSGTIAAGWLTRKLGLTKARMRMLGSPKAHIRDLLVRGTREHSDGYTGNLVAAQWGMGLVRTTPATAEEIAGKARRGWSAQERLQLMQNMSATVTEKIENRFRKLRKDVYGEAGMSNGKFVTQLKSTHASQGIRRLFGRNAEDTVLDFERWADRWSETRARNAQLEDGEPLETIDSIVGEDMLKGLTPDQRKLFEDALDDAANIADEMYEDFGRLEVRMGVLQPEELKAGYRPQIWNKLAIENNPDGFRNWMLEVFGQEPDEDWLRKYFAEKTDAATGEVTVGIREGESMADFAKREKEAYQAAAQEWAIEVKALADERTKLLQKETEKVLEKHNADSAYEVQTRYQLRNAADQKKIAKAQAQIAEWKRLKASKKKAPSREEFAKVEDIILKAERRIAERNKSIQPLLDKARAAEDVEAIARRLGNKENKAKGRKLRKAVDKTTLKAAKQEARRTVTDQIEQLRRNIISNEGIFNLVPGEFKTTSSRWKRRSINLGRHSLDPQADEFLIRDSRGIRDSYARMTGAQLALRQQFGIHGEERLDRTSIIENVLSAYDEDIALATKRGDDKLARKFKREKSQQKYFMEQALKEFLGDHDVGGGLGREATHMALGITATMVLGKVLLSQISDLAIQAFAGGKFSTGLAGLFRNNKQLFRDLEEDGMEELIVVLQGHSTLTGSRFRNLTDMERLDLDVPGSKMSSVQRWIDDVGTVQGYANFMIPWNKFVRGAFGVDFARQIHKHALGGWDQLDDSLKTFYRRHGVDEEIFERFAANYQRGTLRKAAKSKLGTKVGDVHLPDPAKWAEDDMVLWKRLMQSAGDEAMLDPGLLDRPFLRSSNLGRLLLQFQSFAFTAADRYVAPLVQEMRVHPTSIRTYASVIMGMMLAGFNDYLRHRIFGQEKADEWLERWETADGAAQNFQAIFMRTAMMSSSSGWLLETSATTGGNKIMNNGIEAAFGIRPLKEHSKFMTGQARVGLLGPAAGLVNTGLNAVGDVADGDFSGAAETLAQRTPWLNTFYTQALTLYMLKELD